MSAHLETRAHIQREGLRRTRSEAFNAITEAIYSGRCKPSGETIMLIEEIAEKSFRFGVEAQSDALQVEFIDLTERVAQAEAHLHGAESSFPR